MRTAIISLLVVAVLSALVAGIINWSQTRKLRKIGRMVDEIAQNYHNPLTFENEDKDGEKGA